MAQLITRYWRDMPAMITVKAGRKQAKRPLPETFEKAIDAAAMRCGADQSDDYLAGFRTSVPVEVSDDIEAEADRALELILRDYDSERLRELIKNNGYDRTGEQ